MKYIKDNWMDQHYPVRDLDKHIISAADWILHAQSQTNDNGVPHSWDIRQNKWLPSYPETTGYIIPTLFDVSRVFKEERYAKAAERMAIWEADIQLEDGGVMAGHMGAEVVVPTIFNTGQVLFGWARCAQETGSAVCIGALKKAADWLLDAMDEDGAWRKYPSPFAPGSIKLYNVRCAFGLVKAYEVLEDQKYIDAAVRNVEFVLSAADDNGWFASNCLTDNPDALTHTIAYTMRGIMEVGAATQNERFLEFASNMARRVNKLQNEDGSYPARVRADWSSNYNWSCITGNSQLALNNYRLHEILSDNSFLSPAKRANRFNMSMQDTVTRDQNIRGALKGSHPINGGYMTYRYPNWAAKFFIDALLKERSALTDSC